MVRDQDASLTIEEKLPHMRDWYRLNHAEYAKCSIKKGVLKRIVHKALDTRTLVLRDGSLTVSGRGALPSTPPSSSLSAAATTRVPFAHAC